MLLFFWIGFNNGVYALQINCQYSVRTYYTCDGTILTGESDDIVTEILGEHRSGKSDTVVEQLLLKNQNLKFFPRNIENFFSNLKSINVAGNAITDISNRHLKPLELLERLNLHSNKITEIESNLFDGLNLKSVSFNHNHIRHVGNDIQLPTTTILFFSSNPCVNMNAYVPTDVAKLQTLMRNQCPSLERNHSDELTERNLKTIAEDLGSKVFELDVALTSLEKRIAALENKAKANESGFTNDASNDKEKENIL